MQYTDESVHVNPHIRTQTRIFKINILFFYIDTDEVLGRCDKIKKQTTQNTMIFKSNKIIFYSQ